MAIVYLTRVERFNAAHKLWVSSWTEEKNRETFGKCANKNWHGHNYKLEVTVKGIPDPYTGFVMDAKVLKDIIKEHVTEDLDHSNLNMDIDWLTADEQPTTENVAVSIWHRLKPHLAGCELYRIKLVETENIWAEYYGE